MMVNEYNEITALQITGGTICIAFSHFDWTFLDWIC